MGGGKAGALGRVEEKLEAAAAGGRHYEAQQLCLTLAARKRRRDPGAAREILERGAARLLAHGHAGEGADLGIELVKLLEVRRAPAPPAVAARTPPSRAASFECHLPPLSPFPPLPPPPPPRPPPPSQPGGEGAAAFKGTMSGRGAQADVRGGARRDSNRTKTMRRCRTRRRHECCGCFGRSCRTGRGRCGQLSSGSR